MGLSKFTLEEKSVIDLMTGLRATLETVKDEQELYLILSKEDLNAIVATFLGRSTYSIENIQSSLDSVKFVLRKNG